MPKYETLLLAVTHLTTDELSGIENFFEKTATEAKGSLISFDKWGKFRLSYPIKKNDYGLYMLARYEVPKESLKKVFQAIEDFLKLKCNEIVLRSLTTKLNPKAPLEYKQPESVDVGRSGNFDTFLKENKMESFLSTDVTSASPKESPLKKSDTSPEETNE